MAPVELRVTWETIEEAQAAYDENLRHGRALIEHPEALPVLSDCTLVLAGAGAELRLSAQVVMVNEDAGQTTLGVALQPFNAQVGEQIEGFLANMATPASEPPADRQAAPPRHVALRNLPLHEQQKIARTGDLSDRVTLERLYGKEVWPALLQNPKLTVAEVARISRKGTVPRPLLDVILDNNMWLKADPVRRALLSNPRTSSEGVMKLLRLTPRHELKSIHKGTAYSAHIREQARKLLG